VIKKNIYSSIQFSFILYLILPAIIFGFNLGSDFFIFQLILKNYSYENPIFLVAAFSAILGSFASSISCYFVYRNNWKKDTPEEYKKILMIGLLAGALGLFLTYPAFETKFLPIIFISRFFVGFGVTSIHLALYPIIYYIVEDGKHDFWLFFITAFISLGRFFAYPLGYFFINDLKIEANFIFFEIICIIIATISFILSLAIYFNNSIIRAIPSFLWLKTKNDISSSRTETIMGILGLILFGLTDAFLMDKMQFLTTQIMENPYYLITGLTLTSAGLFVTRFAASQRVSSIPNPFKTLISILLSTTILFFVIFTVNLMQVEIANLLIFLILFIIVLLAIGISRNNIYSISATLGICGFILILIFLFTRSERFQYYSLSGFGFFIAPIMPLCISLIFSKRWLPFIALSSFISIFPALRVFIPFFTMIYPDFIKNNIFMLLPLVCFGYLILVGILIQIKYSRLKDGITTKKI